MTHSDVRVIRSEVKVTVSFNANILISLEVTNKSKYYYHLLFILSALVFLREDIFN